MMPPWRLPSVAPPLPSFKQEVMQIIKAGKIWTLQVYSADPAQHRRLVVTEAQRAACPRGPGRGCRADFRAWKTVCRVWLRAASRGTLEHFLERAVVRPHP